MSVGRVPQTCNAAFRSSLLARHVHSFSYRLTSTEWTVLPQTSNAAFLSSLSARRVHHSIDFSVVGFLGIDGTWHGRSRREFAVHTPLGCTLRSDGCAGMNCIGDIGFQPTVHDIGRIGRPCRPQRFRLNKPKRLSSRSQLTSLRQWLKNTTSRRQG